MKLSNPLKGKSRATQILIIIGLALLISAAGAAVYVLVDSNTEHVDVNPNTINVPLSLTVSSNTINEGQSVTITVKSAAAAGNNVNGYTVNLYDNGIQIQSATLAYDGVSRCQAVFTITPAIGGHDYQAKP